MASIYLIRIAHREARKRAIKAFLGVRESWMSFPGDLFGLCSAHVEALKAAQVPFEEAPASDRNGKTPIQP
jgi:hypothetical protein